MAGSAGGAGCAVGAWDAAGTWSAAGAAVTTSAAGTVVASGAVAGGPGAGATDDSAAGALSDIESPRTDSCGEPESADGDKICDISARDLATCNQPSTDWFCHFGMY